MNQFYPLPCPSAPIIRHDKTATAFQRNIPLNIQQDHQYRHGVMHEVRSQLLQ